MLQVTVIIQLILDTVKNIDRFCQFEGSHPNLNVNVHYASNLDLFSLFLFSLQSIELSRSAAYQSNADSSQCFGYPAPSQCIDSVLVNLCVA